MTRLTTLVLLLALLVPLHALALTTQHFQIDGPASIAEEVARHLEEAYSKYLSWGLTPLQPCDSDKYIVEIRDISAAGYTEWLYSSNGAVCVRRIVLDEDLAGRYLRLTAFHEVAHVFTVSYVTSGEVPREYPWFVEALPEALAEEASGICGYSRYYFAWGLYSHNPYDYSGAPRREAYAYAAFMHWLIRRVGAEEAARLVMGDGAVNTELNRYYVEYLLDIADGEEVCGEVERPDARWVSVSGTVELTTTIDGLSAAYYVLDVPPGATVSIYVEPSSGVLTNVPVGKPLRTSGDVILAVVNAATEARRVTITVSVAELGVEVLDAEFDADRMVVRLRLRVSLGGRPYTGPVTINGRVFRAVDGYVEAEVEGGWGVNRVVVSAGGLSRSVELLVARPYVSVEPSELIVASGARGNITVLLSLPEESIPVEATLRVSAPVDVEPREARVLLEPGDQRRLRVRFAGAARGSIRIAFAGVAEEVRLVPVNLTVRRYVVVGDNVTAEVRIPGLGTLNATGALGGVAEVRHPVHGYIIGTVELSAPRPEARLVVRRVVVGPSGTRVYATLTLRACTDVPTIYVAEVGGSVIRAAFTGCGNYATNVTLRFNATSGTVVPRLSLGFAEAEGPAIRVEKPEVSVESVSWTLTDLGLVARIGLRVSGPSHLWYDINGMLVQGGSIAYVSAAVSGGRVHVDYGFGSVSVEAPSYELVVEPKAATLDAETGFTAVPTDAQFLVYLNSSEPIAINATATVAVDGKSIGEYRLSADPGNAAEMALRLDPGVHIVSVSVAGLVETLELVAVRVLNISVSGPRVVETGKSAQFAVEAKVEPEWARPVAKLAISGCGQDKVLEVPVDKRIEVAYERDCRARLTAELLGARVTREVVWARLVVEPVISVVDVLDRPVITGCVSAEAALSIGEPVPARIEVRPRCPEPGPAEVVIRAEYMGLIAERVLRVYAVPETYVELAKLGASKTVLRELAINGDWALVADAVAAAKSPMDPVDVLAAKLVELGLTTDPRLVELGGAVHRYRAAIYAAAATMLVAFVLRRSLG